MKFLLNSIIMPILIGGFVLSGVVLIFISQVSAQGERKGEFGDWNLHCDTPTGAKNEQCTLLQKLTAEERPEISLQVIVIKTADSDEYIMRILAPLGVILPHGLRLQIDSEDKGRLGFVRCIFDGCVAEVILNNELIRDITSGEMATFILFMTPEKGIGLPIKLTGISDGLTALNN